MYPTERVNNFGVNVCLGVLSSAFDRISDILKKDVLRFMIRYYKFGFFVGVEVILKRMNLTYL